MNTKQLSRRQFIGRAGMTLTGITAPFIIPSSVWSKTVDELPSNRITLGFIGVGKQGLGLLRGFLNTPGTQVLAVCDVDELKLQRAKNMVMQHDSFRATGTNARTCAAYRDFCEIVNRTDIDAVVIATPDHWHAIQSIAAIRSGKDVYCEKPLSLTISEGRAMVNQARKYYRIFQTGSMQRSDAKFRHACELVRNGYIGEIRNVRVSIRTGFLSHPIYCDLSAESVPAELDWELWQGPAPTRPFNAILAPPISFDGFPAWRNYYDYSGGGMTDWGAHHFDIAQWGLGMDDSGPVEIIPPNGTDVEFLTYRYRNGTTMTTDFESNLILFTGSEGWIEVNRQYLKTSPAGLVNHTLAAHEIHLYRSANHLLDWLECIRTRNKPITDVEIGCRSVTVCHLGNTAVQLQRPLKWNPDQEVFKNDPEANRTLSRAMSSPWSFYA